MPAPASRTAPTPDSPLAADRPQAVAPALLAWYDRHRRRLPWRAGPAERPDAYRVWLSEIMLQQTTVQTVGRYFADFIDKWPTVADLAAAEREAVLRAWAGLGYYARARNLHACAQAVVRDHGGRFPDSEEELRRLPGIGDYTAAAIAAIAFDRPASPVDGNIERVCARLFAVTDPLPGSKPALRDLAARLTPADRPGDHAQALMDLGATVCTPRRPKCLMCPLSDLCQARAAGIADQLPTRTPKAAKPTRRAIAFFTTDPAGNVLLRTRPDKGLLGGMSEVPSSDWQAGEMPALKQAGTAAPIDARWRLLDGLVRHTFTHFHLELQVAVGRVTYQKPPPGCRWVPVDALGDQALPTVMVKVARHALGQAAR